MGTRGVSTCSELVGLGGGWAMSPAQSGGASDGGLDVSHDNLGDCRWMNMQSAVQCNTRRYLPHLRVLRRKQPSRVGCGVRDWGVAVKAKSLWWLFLKWTFVQKEAICGLRRSRACHVSQGRDMAIDVRVLTILITQQFLYCL